MSRVRGPATKMHRGPEHIAPVIRLAEFTPVACLSVPAERSAPTTCQGAGLPIASESRGLVKNGAIDLAVGAPRRLLSQRTVHGPARVNLASRTQRGYVKQLA